MTTSCRLDKWLWAVRLYKTRSMATDACKRGKIKINNADAKASRIVKVGDVLEVKWQFIYKTIKVLQLTENRLGAKLVPEYLEDLTAPEEYQKLRDLKQPPLFFNTERPTKKNRREWDKLIVHFNNQSSNDEQQ
ncbi:MAG: RNA-binding S4 domain-containing protein [Bacteroidota bacterium]